jgi:hypothetical protein
MVNASEIEIRRMTIGAAALRQRWRECERRGGHYVVLADERLICLHCLVTFEDGEPKDPPRLFE